MSRLLCVHSKRCGEDALQGIVIGLGGWRVGARMLPGRCAALHRG